MAGSSMSMSKFTCAGTLATLFLTIAGAALAAAPDYGIGTPATPAQLRAWDITIGPDGTNLPSGQGDVAAGKALYAQQCASCHGDKGQGGVGPRLAGGIGNLATAHPVKDVGSYWPYATTLFDYIRRAMPMNHPQTLSSDQVYAAAAYILYLNHIVPADTVLNRTTLPKISMPNRSGFVWQKDPILSAHNR
jgi:S-disulfanyl-L-cysteine oxidoreductase SoxD